MLRLVFTVVGSTVVLAAEFMKRIFVARASKKFLIGIGTEEIGNPCRFEIRLLSQYILKERPKKHIRNSSEISCCPFVLLNYDKLLNENKR
jgi:hypothetical protein